MIYLEILKLALPVLVPLLQDLMAKTNIPYLKFKKYKQMDKYADLVLNGLAELKQKVEDEPDSVSKELRLEGFELGCDYVYRLAHKLLDGLSLLDGKYAVKEDELEKEEVKELEEIAENTNILNNINNFFKQDK